MLTAVQVLVDGPTDKKGKDVPRHSAALSGLSLTPIVIANLPRAIGNGPLKAKWEKEGILDKWENSAWAKSRERSDKRRSLNDFERFKVMRLRKQVCSLRAIRA